MCVCVCVRASHQSQTLKHVSFKEFQSKHWKINQINFYATYHTSEGAMHVSYKLPQQCSAGCPAALLKTHLSLFDPLLAKTLSHTG